MDVWIRTLYFHKAIWNLIKEAMAYNYGQNKKIIFTF